MLPLLVKDCKVKYVDLRYWPRVESVIIAFKSAVLEDLGICGLMFRTNLFSHIIRQTKVLNTLYTPGVSSHQSIFRRRHYCRWRTVSFDLCSTLMVIYYWEFFSLPNLARHPFIMVISGYEWHSYQLLSV